MHEGLDLTPWTENETICWILSFLAWSSGLLSFLSIKLSIVLHFERLPFPCLPFKWLIIFSFYFIVLEPRLKDSPGCPPMHSVATWFWPSGSPSDPCIVLQPWVTTLADKPYFQPLRTPLPSSWDAPAFIVSWNKLLNNNYKVQWYFLSLNDFPILLFFFFKKVDNKVK